MRRCSAGVSIGEYAKIPAGMEELETCVLLQARQWNNHLLLDSFAQAYAGAIHCERAYAAGPAGLLVCLMLLACKLPLACFWSIAENI